MNILGDCWSQDDRVYWNGGARRAALLPYHVAFPQNAAVVWQIAPDHEYMLFFACEPGGVGQIQPVEQSDKLPLAEQQLP